MQPLFASVIGGYLFGADGEWQSGRWWDRSRGLEGTLLYNMPRTSAIEFRIFDYLLKTECFDQSDLCYTSDRLRHRVQWERGICPSGEVSSTHRHVNCNSSADLVLRANRC